MANKKWPYQIGIFLLEGGCGVGVISFYKEMKPTRSFSPEEQLE
jgi:hypothetical protein